MRQIKHLILGAYDKDLLLYFVRVQIVHKTSRRDFLMLFDTGATNVGIRENTFRALAIEADKKNSLFTAQGEDKLDSGIADNLILDGNITIENVRINVLPEVFFQGWPARYSKVTGVLGGSFLSRVKFFMGQEFIRIYQDTDDVGYY